MSSFLIMFDKGQHTSFSLSVAYVFLVLDQLNIPLLSFLASYLYLL